MGDKQTDISSSAAIVPLEVTPLRDHVADAIWEAAQPWVGRSHADRIAGAGSDTVMTMMRERIAALPTSMNDLGTTAWVQWLDLAELFGVER